MIPDTKVLDQLNAWWALIVRHEPSKVNNLLMPLSHLWGCHEPLSSLAGDLRIPVEVISGYHSSMPTPEINPDEASFKGVSQAVLLGLRMNLYASRDIEAVLVWAEKLMRYCEIYLPTLKKRALDKWVSAPQAQLGMMHLAAFLLDVYFSTKDLRYLNTVLKLLDLKWLCDLKTTGRRLKIADQTAAGDDLFICGLFQFRLCLLSECALSALANAPEAYHLQDDTHPPRQRTWREAAPKGDMQPKDPKGAGQVHISANMDGGYGYPPYGSNRVVVFSPSRYSLYTITVAELLLRREVDVAAVVVRRLTSPKRFASEFRRDGTRLLRKIFKKLLLRGHAYTGRKFETIADLMRQEGIRAKSVDELCRSKGIAVRYVSDLNDPEVIELLKETSPSLVVFTGGGLIRQPVLDRSGAGVVNCHAGILPPYRGMDVIEWAILEGNPDQVGITVHFMDKGVDTGDILRARRIDIDPQDGLGQIRDRFEPLMCREIVAACLDFLGGRLVRKPQRPQEGRQYFIMHPRLFEITAKRLAGV
jgi:methionyl-tRNA formyltransferase